MSAERRDELLGDLGEAVMDVFPVLQLEVTKPHQGLVHVTPAEADVLRAVLLEPGSSVTEIARTIGQQRSNTSMRIANLVSQGMLEKRVGPGDGREVRVYLTPKAHDNLERFRGAWGAVLGRVSTASEEELEVASRVMRELALELATWRVRARG